ncbi:YncE family protein [Alkalicoccus luteus]|uniref:Uncharacterized protein n=1 Tax=Alkalicoccus luteus TaxID=1237094 RepID=A0A969PUU6_9BACI|nr:YncE family protein [Alkalicoccus luteus]NJP38358.1 hypothetical protein [Alkalicoccus luteus]
MKKWTAGLLGGVLLIAGATPAAAESDAQYEVWMADQGTDTIHIYNEDHEEIDTIDFDDVGENPHMLLFDDDYEYAYAANMGSGTVSVIHGESREVVGTIETDEGAHAAVPNPNGETVLVANTPGESLSQISLDHENGEYEVAQELDLTEVDSLQNEDEFPDHRPICLDFNADGSKAYVTIGGGGLVVVDTEELEVIEQFDKNDVHPHGCGTLLSPDGSEMYANSGSVDDGYFYVFDTETDEMIHKADAGGLDTHGKNFTTDGKYLYTVHRVSDSLTVIDTETKEIVAEQEFVGDAPDLAVTSPDNKYFYVTLRGPEPATGTHDMAGDSPGISVIDVETLEIAHTIDFTGIDGTDPHGIDIRVIDAGSTTYDNYQFEGDELPDTAAGVPFSIWIALAAAGIGGALLFGKPKTARS